MPDTPPSHIALANLLAAARCDGRQMQALDPDLVPVSTDDAYAVSRLVARRLGWEPLGWKIAGTTAAMRAKLRLNAPIYGRAYRRFAVQSPARFGWATPLDPLVEWSFSSPSPTTSQRVRRPGPCRRWSKAWAACTPALN